MVIDSFDPHEPWDPPEEYISLYDEGYEGKEPYAPVYGSADYLEEERAAFVGQSPELAYLRK